VAPFGLMMSLLGGWLQQPRRGLTNDVANGFSVGLRGKNASRIGVNQTQIKLGGGLC
jgi:hypothetical protein